MNCQEVKINLHHFIDEELSSKAKKEVEAHLHGCEPCYNEFKKLRKFFDKLKNLPYTIEPPGDIIDLLSKELLERSGLEGRKERIPLIPNLKKVIKKQTLQDKKMKVARSVVRKSAVSRTILGYGFIKPYTSFGFDWKKFAIIPIILILLAAGYFYYDFQKYNSPWDIQCMDGYAIINGRVNPSGKLEQGESLTADKGSHITVHIPDVGRMELSPNSSIVLEKAKDGDNTVKIIFGNVKVISTAALPSVKIVLPNSFVVDKTGTFSVMLDNNQNTKINVESGFVEIDYKDESVLVKEGFTCEINNKSRPGTPLRKDAPDSLKHEVEKFNYYNGGKESVEKIISMAKEADMLTLLAIIPLASHEQREMLFQAVVNYFPPPLGVTRLGIVNGDKEMLYKWWEDIEWQ